MNVIHNDKQLSTTRNWIKEFEKTVKALEETPQVGLPPELTQIQIGANKAMIFDLQEQIKVYNNMEVQAGKIWEEANHFFNSSGGVNPTPFIMGFKACYQWMNEQKERG